jgi:hypothetical protein
MLCATARRPNFALAKAAYPLPPRTAPAARGGDFLDQRRQLLSIPAPGMDEIPLARETAGDGRPDVVARPDDGD